MASDACGSLTWTYVEAAFVPDCGLSGSTSVTFTVTDECDNSSVTTASFIIQDTISPLIDVDPMDETVPCDGAGNVAALNTWLLDNGGASASEDCGTVSWSHNAGPLSDDCGATGTVNVTFTAIDQCGNTDQASASFTIIDDVAPTITIEAIPQTVECDGMGNIAEYQAWLANFAGAEATDDCGTVTWSFGTGTFSDECGATGFVSIDFTATDECGNTSITTADFIIEDTEEPSIDTPAVDEIVDCDGAGNTAAMTAWLNANGNAMSSDDCGGVSWSYVLGPETAGCGLGTTQEVTFRVTDDCSNTNVTIANFITQDITPPSVDTPASDEIVECDGAGNVTEYQTWLTSNGNAMASDACGSLTWTYVEAAFAADCGLSGSTSVTFTVADECNNTSVTTASFIIQDNTSPLIDVPAVDTTVECDGAGNLSEYNTWVSNNANASASEDCGIISWSNIAGPISDDCGESGTIVVVFTAVDQCGNTDQTTASFIIEDTSPPDFSNVPADIDVECDNLPSVDLPNVSDDCDNAITVSHTDNTIPGSCPGRYIIERTFLVVDDCGNSSTALQTINVSDNTAPILANVPFDVTFECSSVPELGNPVSVTDNCDPNVTVDLTENVIPGTCPQSFTLIRTWTAIDACGNEVIASQNIFVQDVTNPTILNAPTDLNIDCGALPPDPVTITVFDNCDGDVDIVFEEINTLPGFDCTDSYEITRTWTATDDCGNSSVAIQTITVGGDPVPPVLANVPADLTFECSALPPLTDSVQATDNCDPVVDIVYEELTVPSACENTFTIERIWTAIDDCGNSTVAMQTITVEDTTAPVMSNVPINETISCGALPGPAANVLATDNCDTNVNIDFTETSTLAMISCTDSYTVTRVWIATDKCGNSTRSEQEITVVGDDEAPVLAGVPSDITTECSSISESNDNVSATDNCTTNIIIEFNETVVVGDCEDSYEIIKEWTATDDCGNAMTETQSIVVRDNTAPLITNVPADITLDCGQVAPAVPQVFVTDNCDPNVEIVFAETNTSSTFDCTTSYVITRSWEAVDRCGNRTTREQTITVGGDSELPILTGVPADRTVSCEENISNLPSVNATDNCDPNISVDFFENQLGGDCPHAYQLVRTWAATDPCGNIVEQSQTITIEDNVAPVITGVPSDVSESCTGDFDTTIPDVFATDNCDPNVFVQYAENTIPGACPGSFETIRTWSATDACGNETISTQRILVGDNEAPVFMNVPADLTIECGSLSELPAPFATDNCDGDLEVDFVENRVDGSCPGEFIIQRTWSTQDVCGNMTSVTQEIVVKDVTPPTIIGLPADITVNLAAGEEIPAPEDLFIFDNCDPSPSIEVEDTTTGGCTQQITRVYEATDACDNVSSVTQIITVEDGFDVDILTEKTIICSDEFIRLEASPVDAGYAFVWSTDGGELINPESSEVIFSADEAGIYNIMLFATSGDCEATQSIQIVVGEREDVSLVYDAPGCEGDTISIEVVGGISYEWAGPDNFVDSTSQIIIPNISTVNNGTYSVTVSLSSGCTTVLEQEVTAGNNLDIMTDSNGPICQGSTLELFAEGGSTYLWEGPNDFVSNEQNPIITNLSLEPGLHFFELTVSTFSGCEGTEVLSVEVLESEDITTVDDIEICEGDSIELGVNGGFSYQWTGPLSFSSTEQYPEILNATLDMSGEYFVSVLTTSNCTVEKQVNVLVEECECNIDAEIALFTNEICDEGNGSVVLTPSSYDFLWPDLLIASVRNDLSMGVYDITITDEDCEDVITVTIGQVGDCNPCEMPVIADSLIMNSTCGNANGSITITLVDSSSMYTFTWSDNNGIFGEGENQLLDLSAGIYTVTIFDSADSTCAIIEEITVTNIDLPECDPQVECEEGLDIFDVDSIVITNTECISSATRFCLDIPISAVDSFDFFDNGTEIERTVECNFDSTYVYTYFAVPDQGTSGPYTVDSWVVNDEMFSGEFDTLDDLINLLNTWDPNGAWTIDEQNLSIVGGLSANTYGDLVITKISTGEYGILLLNSKFIPFSIALDLTPGEHLINVVDIYSGCADSVNVFVECIETVTHPDTIDLYLELGMDTTICLDQSELSAEVLSVLNYCEEFSTDVVNYEIEEDCINVSAEFLGDDIGCFLYCDENDVCDTLVIFSVVVVEGALAGPFAMDDDTLTLVNWHVLNFDLQANDTFNVETDSIIITSNPYYGTVRANIDGTFNYIPDEDFCGEIDSFTYIIIGPFGTDEATVYIDLLCEDLTIFNGISPNGDGINDSFTITGIEAFQNNTVVIFNRWGNQVFYRQGYTNDYGWEGRWNGRPLPDGTYFYVVDTGEGRKFTGYIQIHR